jgi:hypothetical protein
MKKTNAVIFFVVMISAAFAIASLYNKLKNQSSFELDPILRAPVNVIFCIAGIIFCTAAVYSVSSGFRKKFPMLPFDNNILDSTYLSVRRALLVGVLGSIGALLLENTISSIASLILDFIYLHK